MTNVSRVMPFLFFTLTLAASGCVVDRTFLPGLEHLHSVDAQIPLPPARPDSILVVTYNIQFGRDPARAAADLRQAGLGDVDVLLVQEMNADAIDTLAAALGMHARYQPAGVGRRRNRGFGNAVLSRWPITDTRMTVLPHRVPVFGWRRVAVACDLDIAGQPLRVVCLHLETVLLDQRSRLAQAMAALVLVGNDWSGPVIVGGDFNFATPVGLAAARRLYREHAGLRPVNQGPDCTIRGTIWRLMGVGCRLDLIFYRGLAPGAAGVATEARASDHFPVWARFAWPPARAGTL
jgi:endonuclease/exonuclease/phosphatase family metal-dependent hydrolase